jgi:hypothetical protein
MTFVVYRRKHLKPEFHEEITYIISVGKSHFINFINTSIPVLSNLQIDR